MMNEKNKNDLDALLASYKIASCLLDPTIFDAAMLATVVQMAQDGKDEMALYVLHNIKPYAPKPTENSEKEEEPEIDIGGLFSSLFN